MGHLRALNIRRSEPNPLSGRPDDPLCVKISKSRYIASGTDLTVEQAFYRSAVPRSRLSSYKLAALRVLCIAAAVIIEAQPTTGACFSFTSAFTLCGEAGNCSTVAC